MSHELLITQSFCKWWEWRDLGKAHGLCKPLLTVRRFTKASISHQVVKQTPGLISWVLLQTWRGTVQLTLRMSRSCHAVFTRSPPTFPLFISCYNMNLARNGLWHTAEISICDILQFPHVYLGNRFISMRERPWLSSMEVSHHLWPCWVVMGKMETYLPASWEAIRLWKTCS